MMKLNKKKERKRDLQHHLVDERSWIPSVRLLPILRCWLLLNSIERLMVIGIRCSISTFVVEVAFLVQVWILVHPLQDPKQITLELN